VSSVVIGDDPAACRPNRALLRSPLTERDVSVRVGGGVPIPSGLDRLPDGRTLPLAPDMSERASGANPPAAVRRLPGESGKEPSPLVNSVRNDDPGPLIPGSLAA
jgi:hypothetical protein